jgi:polyphosphate kinase
MPAKRVPNKRRARLNSVAHLLKAMPFKRLPYDRVRLPRRTSKGRYDDQRSLRGMKFVADRY